MTHERPDDRAPLDQASFAEPSREENGGLLRLDSEAAVIA